ncbi:MAG TPA: SAM-dependent methyltransferase [Opitutaceae bacterium]|nr:SAM-dependent methyltransferase [Opitutaceae bacterium]
MRTSARDRFIDLLRTSVRDGTLVKLTLGKYRGRDSTLRNLFVRPVTLKAGPQLGFVWRHATRDITKNHSHDEALAELAQLVGVDFLDAHLFTQTQAAQLETGPDGQARLKVSAKVGSDSTATGTHDRTKQHIISADAPWLRALGVTNERGHPREGMADKFRQIQKFAELLSHLIADAGLEIAKPADAGAAEATGSSDQRLHVVDMGSGKGYLTFALATVLGEHATVRGIEARPELVAQCNDVVHGSGMAQRLSFSAGTISDVPLERIDILVALHACDTATDDALARGIAAGARLLVVAPCCQKELRRQLKPPPVLSGPLRHGIFQERQAEFVTDALRTELLEWAGYRTKAFEFISTEHTAKNLMIAGIKARLPGAADDLIGSRIRELAAFFGIRSHRLAQHLGFSLLPDRDFVPAE